MDLCRRTAGRRGGLARIGPHEQHAAVTEPDMGHLHDHRYAIQQNPQVTGDPPDRLALDEVLTPDPGILRFEGGFLRLTSSGFHFDRS